MKRRTKIAWRIGDVFAVPLLNNKFAIGQVLEQSMVNMARIALYDKIITETQNIDIKTLCNETDLISLMEVFKQELDFGRWKILGNKDVSIPIDKQPNEKFRKINWVGAVTYDAGLAEDFLNAFYSLIAWDDWGNPIFLTNFLLIFQKSQLSCF